MAVLLCLLLAGPALAGWTQVGDNGTENYTSVYGWATNDVMVVGYAPG